MRRGWFAGLRNPQIGAALRLIHGRPTDPWTLDSLAREIGLSRSAFAEQFTAYVQIPPMQYLGRWRVQIAARLLDTRGVSIAQAAAESRLSVRGGVQPRFQEVCRSRSRRLAARPKRSIGDIVIQAHPGATATRRVPRYL